MLQQNVRAEISSTTVLFVFDLVVEHETTCSLLDLLPKSLLTFPLQFVVDPLLLSHKLFPSKFVQP